MVEERHWLEGIEKNVIMLEGMGGRRTLLC